MKKITSEWLKSASYDLLLIEEIKFKETLTHIAAFHAQQAIEKSLKAILEEKGVEIPKIHKLKTLFAITGMSFENDNEELMVKMLDSLYIEARYPGDMGLLPEGKPSVDDILKFYEFAQSIMNRVKGVDRIKKTP